MERARSALILRAGILGAAALILLTLAFSQDLAVREFTEKTDKVTGDIKIMVLSDLHDTYYGENQQELINVIENQLPDIILFTGDMLDDKKDTGAAMKLFNMVGGEYPCYYVSGNHEFWSGKIDEIKERIRECGITVLEGAGEVIMAGNQHVRICGIDDTDVGKDEWNSQLAECERYIGDDVYTVLMTHRPEQILRYQGYDMIVSGHTHGGVLRIPGILNGLYAPGQGWFPKYGGGRYDFGDKIMIVSRGLSKSRVPRIFTPPEIVVINIMPK